MIRPDHHSAFEKASSVPSAAVKGDNGHTGPAISRKKILQYFANERADLRQLPDHWNAIGSYYFDHEQLTRILEGLSDKILIKNRNSKNNTQIYYPFRTGEALHLWLDKFHALETKDTECLTRNLTSFSKLGLRPPSEFLSTCWAVPDLDRLHPYRLSKLIYACARTAIVPPKDFMRSWIGHYGAKINQMGISTLSHSLWSLSVFSAITQDPDFKQVIGTLLPYTKGFSLHKAAKYQINMAALQVDAREYLRPIHPDTIDDYRSRWEQELEKHFAEAGNIIASPKDHYSCELSRFLDIRLRTERGQEVIVEADGHFHKVYDMDLHKAVDDGSTILQTDLMSRIYPEAIILRLDINHTANYLRQRAGQTPYFAHEHLARSLTDQFPALIPGAYASCLNETGHVGLKSFFNHHALPQVELAQPRPPVNDDAPPADQPVPFRGPS